MTLAALELPFPSLDLQCAESRCKFVAWLQLFEKGIISADEMSILVELSDRSTWPELLVKNDPSYITAPLAVLESGRIEEFEVVVAVLTLLYDLFTQHTDYAERMLSEAHTLSFAPISRFLLRGDEMVAGHAARLLSILALLRGPAFPLEDAKIVVDWIEASIMLFPDKEQRALLATLVLEHLLRVEAVQTMLMNKIDALGILAQSLTRCRNVQIQYQAVFAIWIISFNARNAAFIQKYPCIKGFHLILSRFGIIPLLVDIARTAVKEKVVRICVSTWKNYLLNCKPLAVPVMIGSKVLKYLETISSRKIADEELVSDMNFIKEELEAAYRSLNSYDEYVSEIKSGKLEWSPPHKSELFWSDNAARLCENDYEILRLLSAFLKHATDPSILSIAVHDLGQYVTHHQLGKRNIENLGIKQQIMHLISHEHPEVRFQALNAVQKYMEKLWSPA